VYETCRNAFICFLGSEILVVPSHFTGPQDWPAFDDTLSGPLYKSNTTNCCSLDESISAQRISSERSPLLDIILAFLLALRPGTLQGIIQHIYPTKTTKTEYCKITMGDGDQQQVRGIHELYRPTNETAEVE
jgi:hypothetical protein